MIVSMVAAPRAPEPLSHGRCSVLLACDMAGWRGHLWTRHSNPVH